MGSSDRFAEIVYRIATGGGRLKAVMTAVGAVFWLSVSTVLVLISLWLDRFFSFPSLIPVPVAVVLALPLIVAGTAVYLWKAYIFIREKGTPVPFNPPPELVITGLYARVRNPMLTGWIVMLIGMGILFNSISMRLIFTLLFVMAMYLYVVTIEEKELEMKFGKQYLEYKQRVPRFIPRFGNKT